MGDTFGRIRDTSSFMGDTFRTANLSANSASEVMDPHMLLHVKVEGDGGSLNRPQRFEDPRVDSFNGPLVYMTDEKAHKIVVKIHKDPHGRDRVNEEVAEQDPGVDSYKGPLTDSRIWQSYTRTPTAGTVSRRRWLRRSPCQMWCWSALSPRVNWGQGERSGR